jgi:proteasome lid subunit RPN8/RPN11
MNDGWTATRGQGQTVATHKWLIKPYLESNIMNNEILIVSDAWKSIRADSMSFTVETGGILVGTLGDPISIVDAGISGENSVHHPVQFTSDPIADKKCLEEANKRYGKRIVTVGWWHKHPYGSDRPSGGDLQQVSELSKEYNDGKPVLMGIVTQRGRWNKGTISLRLYSLGDNKNLIEYDWKLVLSSNSHLRAAIENASMLPETKPSSFWTDSDFRFHLNPIGRNQLRTAGFRVTSGQRKEDKNMIMDVSDGRISLRFVFPPEFPLNPPAVYAGPANRLFTLHTLHQWNSLCTLVEVAREARDSLKIISHTCSEECDGSVGRKS